MVQKTVTPALPYGYLIAFRSHLSVPIDNKADQVFLWRCLFDLDRRDIMKIPLRLSKKVVVPPGEIDVAGERCQPGERDVHLLVVEMAQIEVGWRCVFEMGEPFVEK